MWRTCSARVVLFVLVLFVCTSAVSRAAAPGIIVLRGGVVVTMDSNQPVAEAIVLRGDRIEWVGRERDLKVPKGPDVRIIDLDGRCVIPGFIEGHGHFITWGRQLLTLDLSRTKSWNEIVEMVAAEVKRRPGKGWIIGRGWHQEKWDRPPEPNVEGYPTNRSLDDVSGDRPVLLLHGTGHMAIANTAALRLAGVDARTPDPPGGRILRDDQGRPTGVLRENAMGKVRASYDRWERGRPEAERKAETIRAIERAGEECHRYGVTSFQDAGVTLEEVALFRELASKGRLPVRIAAMLIESNERLERHLAEVRVVGFGGNFLTVRAIKRMFDGALGTHGAWMLSPYEDLPGRTGHNTLSVGSLRETARLALAHDYQLCVHAIGDRANRVVLDVFEELLSGRPGGRVRRWRIEHAQHLDPADIPRFAKLGVVASMQGVHATSDGPFVVRRLGYRRARQGAYAWRSLLDSGAVVMNGTDVPVERIDPIACLFSSVTRKMPNGKAFFPEQAMTREEALASYTRSAAWGAFEEAIKGTVTAGKLADLVVLDKNPLACSEDELKALRVEMTILGGRIVWDAGR